MNEIQQCAVKLESVSKSYKIGSATIEVLKEVNITINRKERVAIVGASGVGKTTLLNIIGTVDRPCAGSVYLLDKDVLNMNEVELSLFRNKSIGFVFQFHYLISEMTALENVMLPGMISKMRMYNLRERAFKLLDEVQLIHRAKHKPSELSGGERQRVAIARAMFLEPEILLADEPIGDLDPATGKIVFNLLEQLVNVHSTTLIVATHNREIEERLDTRYRIRDGFIFKE